MAFSHDDTTELPPSDNPRQRFFGPSPERVRVDIAGISDPGRVRENNEDHYLIVRRRRSRTVLGTNLPAEDVPELNEDAFSLVIADGMGGAAFGEFASRHALRTAWELGLSEIKWPLKIDPDESREVLEKLTAYVELLHEALLDEIRFHPELEGMGTTFTLAYTVGFDGFLCHVGDSRAYLLRDGAIQCLTRDHTLARTALDAGMTIDDEQQLKYLNRVLVKCLGGKEGAINPDVQHFVLQPGDRLMLCTDGLSDLVTDEEIAACVAQHSESEAACRALVDLALDRGGTDNVTVLMGKYERDESEPLR
ncbi:MAG: serine/threonine-protein phosphatase [Planctomyces sp.]|nr:serine/threonine-protein phosphatase [Planctomyces sp.]